MKNILLLTAAALLAASCQESLEDRAEREAREMTRKNCPMKLEEGVTHDSLVFHKNSLTLQYCLTLSGRADTTAILKDKARQSIVESVKGNTSLRPYKEAGYNFMYTYYSEKHPGMKLFETTVTKKDYSGGESRK